MTSTLFAALFLVTLFTLPAAVLVGAAMALWPSHGITSAVKSARHAAAHA